MHGCKGLRTAVRGAVQSSHPKHPKPSKPYQLTGRPSKDSKAYTLKPSKTLILKPSDRGNPKVMLGETRRFGLAPNRTHLTRQCGAIQNWKLLVKLRIQLDISLDLGLTNKKMWI